MRVAVFIEEAELDHRVVPLDVALDVNDPVVLQVLLDVFLKDKQGIGKIHFQGTGIIGAGFHGFRGDFWRYAQRSRADAQVNPLPNAAKQITSLFFTLPSAQASLKAMGIDAAVVFPYRMMLLYTWSSRNAIFC